MDDPQTGKFTWTIENFSKINLRKHYSETFTVGGYKWYALYLHFYILLLLRGVSGRVSYQDHLCCCRRVLLFPKGNNVDHLSVYLDVADSAQLPYGWSRFAHFTLAVVNQYDPKLTVKKGSYYNCFMLHELFSVFILKYCKVYHICSSYV